MELYARVRRAVQIEQMSEREAARTFGLSRETVRKMLKFSLPPGYRRRAPIRRPKLEAYIAVIEQILELDKSIHRKQRHSVKRIFERLRDEHGYLGGYTVVKDYVREQKQRRKEMFVPLKHAPGQAQVDFGEADIYVNGLLERAHFFVIDLPHSDDCVRDGVSGRDHGSILRRAQSSVCLLQGSAANDSVRQHEDRLCPDIWGMGRDRRREPLANCRATICLRNGLGGRAKATTKGKWKGWLAMHGAISWCPYRV